MGACASLQYYKTASKVSRRWPVRALQAPEPVRPVPVRPVPEPVRPVPETVQQALRFSH
ncbi:hypothetical protein JQK88_31565 [Mesorhizobium caraganae]|uniref:hypothetical protein n=1 Tax=Mesorhizobium caraganae TaxID=483206 RepID=UPI00193A298A|nr:hypothetical protein [Mesorhizobium caraganae]MBM2715661.1 hypothetical protein [Mesorhizobium caraganae]